MPFRRSLARVSITDTDTASGSLQDNIDTACGALKRDGVLDILTSNPNRIRKILEDSGFFVRAIGEFPKTHVKFSLETLGIDNILKTLKGVKDRHAEWRMCVAYVSGPNEHKLFTFVEPGEIAEAPREVKRDIMSDYWRIYIPKTDSGNKLALSEMAEEDLAKWRKYNTERNQFDMLGRWLSEGKAI